MIGALFSFVWAIFALWFIPLVVWIAWAAAVAYLPEYEWAPLASAVVAFFGSVYLCFGK
jgi:hypothetical protein